jgi:hypothetical protein
MLDPASIHKRKFVVNKCIKKEIINVPDERDIVAETTGVVALMQKNVGGRQVSVRK